MHRTQNVFLSTGKAVTQRKLSSTSVASTASTNSSTKDQSAASAAKEPAKHIYSLSGRVYQHEYKVAAEKHRAARAASEKRTLTERANQILAKNKLCEYNLTTEKCLRASKKAGECLERMENTIISVEELIEQGNEAFDNLDKLILTRLLEELEREEKEREQKQAKLQAIARESSPRANPRMVRKPADKIQGRFPSANGYRSFSSRNQAASAAH